MSSYPAAHAVSSMPPPPGAGGPPGAGPPVPDNYFTESRKGEINELRQLLRDFSVERDPQRKRDSIKKVIAYMTLGINVSRLFSEMMLAIETRDLVIKKMVYLYLTNYARTHPELAQMCTNTLQKDCGNDDPMVRGLALRALCGLNLPSMVEYIAEPLRRALTDGHAYVRKTGVMGVLKMYHLDPEGLEASGMIDTLYDMLRDPDASVVVNCVIVLNELMQKSPAGGMAINRAIMLHLLNRIHEFNEFAKVQILELVPRYIPAHEEEGYQIMNLLDPVLNTAGSAAVMATIRAFLSLADQLGDDLTHMKRQICTRIKAPLVTQISSASSEVMCVLLKHVETLTELCPGILDDEYRQFFVRYSEPTYVKYLKVTVLPRLANPDTAPDIVSELAECVYDHNAKLGRLSVRSMARIACIACSGQGGPGAAEAIARRLVEMLDYNVDHICSEAATGLALMVRKHAALKTLVAPPLVRSLKYVTEPAGRASVIFLLGECGDVVKEAPYALERLIDGYDDLNDAGVKIALLSSTMRLFFMRPPEVQKMLGRLLAKATNDVSSQDLHDRALLYYRLLKSGTDPRTLEVAVGTDTHIVDGVPFSEDQNDELLAELMEEFNTLSIWYGKTSVNFIAPEYQVKYVRMPEDHPLAPGQTDSATPLAPPPVPAPPALSSTPAPAPPAPLVTAAAEDFDLLGFGGPSPTASPAAAAPQQVVAGVPARVSPRSPAGLRLDLSISMTGDEYQSQWGAIADSEALVSTVPLPRLPPSTAWVESALARVGVQTMASGELPTEFKFFLYAQDASPTASRFLIQANVEKSSEPLMILTVKVRGGGGAAGMVEQLANVMATALK